jgi:DNA-directed RNA polymerase specialized sigma subunit
MANRGRIVLRRKRRAIGDTSSYYIDKEEYTREIMAYKETGKASERLGEIFLLHVTRLSSTNSFKDYTFKNDMESVAIVHLLKYSKGYDPSKGSNAFNYCTTFICRAFVQVIQKEKKQSIIKDALIKNQGSILKGSAKIRFSITDLVPESSG